MSTEKRDKESIKIYPSDILGPCIKCRHANQETSDFKGLLVACKFGFGLRYGKNCDQQLRDKNGNLSNLWLYEEYDGKNTTWFSDKEMEIVIDK